MINVLKVQIEKIGSMKYQMHNFDKRDENYRNEPNRNAKNKKHSNRGIKKEKWLQWLLSWLDPAYETVKGRLGGCQLCI